MMPFPRLAIGRSDVAVEQPLHPGAAVITEDEAQLNQIRLPGERDFAKVEPQSIMRPREYRARHQANFESHASCTQAWGPFGGDDEALCGPGDRQRPVRNELAPAAIEALSWVIVQ